MARYILIEGFVVGISVLVLGIVVSFAVVLIVPTPEEDWNKYHVMEISLFATGFFTHILWEILGWNMWFVNYVLKNM